MFCYRALTKPAAKVLSDGRSVKWLVVENAGDLPLLHVINEPSPLIAGGKS